MLRIYSFMYDAINQCTHLCMILYINEHYWIPYQSIYRSIDRSGNLGWCNGLQARLAYLHDWARISLFTPFMRPYATFKKRRLVYDHHIHIYIRDFTVPAKHRVEIKENEKRDRYLNLARELKKLLNMKVTVIPIVIVALGTITKVLVKRQEDLEIRGLVETIHTHTKWGESH